MTVFGFLIIWMLSIFLVALANKSGSSHSSSGWWEQAKREHRENCMKDLEDMLKRVVTEGQKVVSSDYDTDKQQYYVHITWEKYGKRFGKTLETFTLRGMENEIRKLQ